jgi:hypothetical protein
VRGHSPVLGSPTKSTDVPGPRGSGPYLNDHSASLQLTLRAHPCPSVPIRGLTRPRSGSISGSNGQNPESFSTTDPPDPTDACFAYTAVHPRICADLRLSAGHSPRSVSTDRSNGSSGCPRITQMHADLLSTHTLGFRLPSTVANPQSSARSESSPYRFNPPAFRRYRDPVRSEGRVTRGRDRRAQSAGHMARTRGARPSDSKIPYDRRAELHEAGGSGSATLRFARNSCGRLKPQARVGP